MRQGERLLSSAGEQPLSLSRPPEWLRRAWPAER